MESFMKTNPEILSQILQNLDKISLLNLRLVSSGTKKSIDSFIKKENNFKSRFKSGKTLKNFLNAGIIELLPKEVEFGFNLVQPICDPDLISFFDKFGEGIETILIDNGPIGTPTRIENVQAWIQKNVERLEASTVEYATIPVEIHEKHFDENGNVVELDKKKEINKMLEDKVLEDEIGDNGKIYQRAKLELPDKIEEIKDESFGIINPNLGLKGMNNESEKDFGKEKEFLQTKKESCEINIPLEIESEPEELNQKAEPEADNEAEQEDAENAGTSKPPKTNHFKLGNYLRIKFINEGGEKKKLSNPDFLPIPYNPEGYEDFKEFYPHYLGRHYQPMNRRLHVIGTISALLFFLIGLVSVSPILFGFGILIRFACVWSGHAFCKEERSGGRWWKQWAYSVLGDLKMSWEVATGQRLF